MSKFFDTHTHSQFSPDSRTTVSELLAEAREQGLAGITITDHLDLDAPRNPGLFEFSISSQQEAIDQAKADIFPGGECKVLKGIEIGLQSCSIEHSREYIAGYEFDQIIASIHFIDGQDPFYGGYYEDKEYKQAYSRTLELIYQTARDFGDFDVIGHFDYVARYAPYSVKDITYADFPDELDTLLKFLSQEGKALEVNTKTYSLQNARWQKPDIFIFKRFKELGGELVTFGSDAHDASRLADSFSFYAQMLQECGFPKLAYFEKRKPHLYNPLTF